MGVDEEDDNRFWVDQSLGGGRAQAGVWLGSVMQAIGNRAALLQITDEYRNRA